MLNFAEGNFWFKIIWLGSSLGVYAFDGTTLFFYDVTARYVTMNKHGYTIKLEINSSLIFFGLFNILFFSSNIVK